MNMGNQFIEKTEQKRETDPMLLNFPLLLSEDFHGSTLNSYSERETKVKMIIISQLQLEIS